MRKPSKPRPPVSTIANEVAEGRVKPLNATEWALAQEHKRRMPRLRYGVPDPGASVFVRIKKGDAGAFLARRKNGRVRVSPWKNPTPRGSFGFIGAFLEVKAKERVSPGVLVVPLAESKLDHVDVRSLRLFRWNEKLGSFELVRESGVGEGGEYVWALIEGPGRFGVIGLRRDPAVRAAVRAFAAMDPYLRAADVGLRKGLQSRLCELVLCDPEWEDAFGPGNTVDRLPDQGLPDEFPGGGFRPGGTGCAECRELVLPNGGLPDVGLLPEREARRPFEYHWASMGPRNIAGCIFQVVVDPGDSRRIYAAAADGGVWVLDDVDAHPFQTWRPLTDTNRNSVAQAVAIAPTEPGTIYYADGTTNILRSTDRGQSWETPSDQVFDWVRRIAIDPTDRDTVYVAASSGFWRTTSGGFATASSPGWTRLHEGYFTDVVIDPDDSRVVYAGRRMESLPGGVRAMQLLRSTDRALTWRYLHERTVPGNARSTMVRIALGRRGDAAHRTVGVKFGTEVWVNRRRRPGRAQPIVNRPFVSKGTPGDNGTDRLNDGQDAWCHVFAIDPFDDDVMLAGGLVVLRTTNGGASWHDVPTFHEDQQSLVFDPSRRGRVFSSHDGGVAVSDDNGSSFDPGRGTGARDLSGGLMAVQFYRAGIAGSRVIANAYHLHHLLTADVTSGQWHSFRGFEFWDVYGDRHRPNFFYVLSGNAGEELMRRRVPPIPGQASFIRIAPHPNTTGGFDPKTIAVDPTPNSTRLLVGATFTVSATDKRVRLLRTEDAHLDDVVPNAGPDDEWGRLEPPMRWRSEPGIDLPANDEITSIVFAPGSPAVAYAATSTGKVFICRDVPGDGEWELAGQAPFGIGGLAVNPADENRVFAFAGSHVLRSVQGGATGSWEEVPGTAPSNLPGGEFHSILMLRSDRLYLGSHTGVFLSPDEGAQWFPIDGAGLPNVPVKQLLYDGGMLYALTMGRGLWRTATDT